MKVVQDQNVEVRRFANNAKGALCTKTGSVESTFQSELMTPK